jgi:hypothetical protein
VLAVAVVLGGGWLAYRQTRDPAGVVATGPVAPTDTAGSVPAAPPSTPPPTPTPTPTATPTPPPTPTATPPEELEAAALAELDAVRRRDLARVRLDGRWLPQVASKYVGVEDPLQTAADGSHRFDAVDVLAEHQRLRRRFPTAFLLLGSDYGRRRSGPGGEPIWVTFVDGDFRSEGAVRAWCERRYANLTARERDNSCQPRRVQPKG